ncbi:MAG: peptidase domain-containing ABC transporter, partial [Sideroxyarcus sp.]|nr:peptidase domain-containing ABC transporter [Sideroxyarcus sp.]
MREAQETGREPEKPFPHTAVQCMAAIAQHHGIAVSPDSLIHNHALDAREPSLSLLGKMAQDIGLKFSHENIRWESLSTLTGVFPLLARLGNGNFVILLGVNRDNDAPQVAVVDPLVPGNAVLHVSQEKFCASWGGDIVFLKRVYSLGDPEQPFGLRWFFPEILKHKRIFRDIAIAAVMLILISLATPIFFQLVIDKVLVHHSYSTLYVLSVGIIVALLFEAGFGFLRQFLLLSATKKIDISLARRTFSHLLALPINFFETISAGVVVRHMQQADKIRQFLTGKLFLTLLDAVALVVFLPLLFFYSAKLAAIVIIFTGLIAGVVVLLIVPFRSRLRDLYVAEGERQAMLVESIHGMRTVKSLAIEPVQRKHWDQKAAAAVTMHFRVGQISVTAQSLTGFLEKSMTVAIIAMGAQDVFDQQLTVGALIAFNMISGRVVSPLVQIVSLVHEYQETALSVKMLGEVMNRPKEGRAGMGGVRPVLQGGIEFEKVTFRYPGSTVAALDSVTFSILPGQVIGVVGRSGSGKSTLTKLIQGLYPVLEGVVRFDGIDAREIELACLRGQIGVVLQDNFLFRGTIRENIAASSPGISHARVVEAAKVAGADEFIERLPQSYDTVLEENGANLSGGQKQRLSIARAILGQPRILILDEAASA